MDDSARLAQIRARLERDLEGRRLDRAGSGDEVEPAPWGAAPLVALIKEDNPHIRQKAPGKLVTGHQPVHPSRRGDCLVIWTGTGTYWCSHCHEQGNAVTWLMRRQGISYRDAAREVERRFGLQTTQRPQAPSGWRRVP